MPLNQRAVYNAFQAQLGRFKWGERDCFGMIHALAFELVDEKTLAQVSDALAPYWTQPHSDAVQAGLNKNKDLFKLYEFDLLNKVDRLISIDLKNGALMRQPGDIILMRGNAILINNMHYHDTRVHGPLICFVDLDHTFKTWCVYGLLQVSGGGTPVYHWRFE